MKRNAASAYALELGTAMVAYALLLVAATLLLAAHPHAPWRFPLLLAPVVPVLFALRAVLRFVGRLDEMQRRMQLEALAFAFAVAVPALLAYGLLELGGAPHLPLLWVAPALVALWGIGAARAAWRYGR